MSNFGRKFPKPWMDILKQLPTWWQDVLDCKFTDTSKTQQPLFLAIRNGYLNAYVEGQSVMKVRFTGTKLYAKIHHKYILDHAEGQKYQVFDGIAVDGIPYLGKIMLSKWVERAQKFAQPKHSRPDIAEKQGVAVIANRNPHVIDVEMGLPGLVADRIDIVALERAGSAINIVFYEAKTFANTSLRAKTFPPKVVEQLSRYEKWLATDGREKEVIEAYRETCKLLLELRMMQGAAYVHDLIADASGDGSNLRVDPKPRLVIFGYDEKSRGDPHWTSHEQILLKSLGKRRLIMEQSPEDVKLPEDAHREG